MYLYEAVGSVLISVDLSQGSRKQVFKSASEPFYVVGYERNIIFVTLTL